MRAKKHFTPITLGAASAAVLLGLAAGSAQAGTIDYAIDADNIAIDDPVPGETSIYSTDTTVIPLGDRTGYLVVESPVLNPGIAAYTGTFGTAGDTYAGCIMSSQGELGTTNPGTSEVVTIDNTCAGSVDSGKRFKLRAAQLNQPVDIVFNISQDSGLLAKQYNVYAKLTNADVTGAAAKGFRIQLGQGGLIGDAFVESDGTDPMVLLPALNQPTVVGKFPGGLFGGSPAEGLPFFDVESASFGFTQSGDSISTTGMPSVYTSKFGDWLAAESVPTAYFWDDDGDPRTDDRLLAYQDGSTWYTYDKRWTSSELVLGGGALPNIVDLGDTDLMDAITVNRPEANPYNNPFANLRNFTTYLNDYYNPAEPYKVQDVVDGLLDIYQLERQEVTDTYAGWTMSFDLGGAREDIGNPVFWGQNPVTVKSGTPGQDPDLSTAGLTIAATWRPECGDEGLYEVASVGTEPFTTTTLTTLNVNPDSVCGVSNTATADDIFNNVVGWTDDPTTPTIEYYAIPGYSQGAIEDLANVNLFYSIGVEEPTVTGAPMTLRITTNDVATSAIDPVVSTGSSGGCTIGSAEGKGDWTLPALLAAMLGFGLMRRRRGQAFKA